MKINKIQSMIFGIIALYALYLIYLVVITLMDVIPNEILYGGLYSQYIYNAYLQLTFSFGILTASVFMLIASKIKAFKRKKALYQVMLGLNALLPLIYVFLYYSIESQMVESNNLLFILVSITTAVPISTGLFSLIMVVFQKK